MPQWGLRWEEYPIALGSKQQRFLNTCRQDDLAALHILTI